MFCRNSDLIEPLRQAAIVLPYSRQSREKRAEQKSPALLRGDRMWLCEGALRSAEAVAGYITSPFAMQTCRHSGVCAAHAIVAV